MIASLRGVVTALLLDRAVLEVGGVGYLILATPATLGGLRVGAEARVATSLVVREDSMTLYAFADDDAREVFETVQTVSGVGPRLALAMLAVHTPDGVRRAVSSEDLAALKRVPGIGHKGAQRIVLELQGKLTAPAESPGQPVQQPAAAADHEAVVEALVGLGWSAPVAGKALDAVLDTSDGDSGGTTIGHDVPALLRATLQYLGGRHD